MTLQERSEIRKRKIVGYRAANFEEAELWDLEYWLKQTPEERLSALVAIRNDIEKVRDGKIRTTKERQP